MLIYLKLYRRPGHMSTYHATFFIKSQHYCMQYYSCGTRFYFYKIAYNIILHATILGMSTKMQLILAIARYIAHNIVLHVSLTFQGCIIMSIDNKVTYIKNCDPLVFGPLLAMDNSIGLSCFS